MPARQDPDLQQVVSGSLKTQLAALDTTVATWQTLLGHGAALVNAAAQTLAQLPPTAPSVAPEPSSYTEFERGLFNQGDLAGREITLSAEQAQALLDGGSYRSSTGFPYGSVHYRRSNPDGSCLHLVWRDGEPRLHHDTFDPHASPMSLFMHLSNEARSETAATCALAFSVIRLLGR